MAGRPSDYNNEIAGKILGRLANGESLRHICADEELPDKATIFRWLLVHAEFRDQYARAREEQAEYWAEEILDIADDGTNDWVERENKYGSKYLMVDHDHIARSRLRVDSRKWLMSKLLPKKYGDKLVHAGDTENPVQHVVERIERVIVNTPNPDSKDIPPTT